MWLLKKLSGAHFTKTGVRLVKEKPPMLWLLIEKGTT